MSELDDPRLVGVMRAFLRSVDRHEEAVLAAAEDGESEEGGAREVVASADARRLAELVLRKHLTDLGWVAPRRRGATERTRNGC